MSSPTVRLRRLGHEGEPVAIIDNFIADPDALRGFAETQEFEPAGRHYPGIKARLPDHYLSTQGPLIATIASKALGLAGPLSLLEARFSVVTAPPDALSLEQRLPHVDALEEGRLALIHYLVPGGTYGTGFYRHRATGYETIDPDRRDRYFAALDRDLRTQGLPDSYIAGDTPLYAQTDSIDGVYNRALLYRSRLLHSGAIPRGAALPADPRTGRLTVTGFFAA